MAVTTELSVESAVWKQTSNAGNAAQKRVSLATLSGIDNHLCRSRWIVRRLVDPSACGQI